MFGVIFGKNEHEIDKKAIKIPRNYKWEPPKQG